MTTRPRYPRRRGPVSSRDRIAMARIQGPIRRDAESSVHTVAKNMLVSSLMALGYSKEDAQAEAEKRAG